MKPPTPRTRSRLAAALAVLLGAWFAVGDATGAGDGREAPSDVAADLKRHNQALRDRLAASPLGIPVLLESAEVGDRIGGTVHALLEQPFERVASVLRDPAEWCNIVLLQPNARNCVRVREGGRDTLVVDVGTESEAGSTQDLRFVFRDDRTDADALRVSLQAPDGPYGTADYRISAAAVPVADGTFLRLRYGYDSSFMSRLATHAYLSTFGRDKVGFTVLDTDAQGRPRYVQGRRGIAERNAARYFFALQASVEPGPGGKPPGLAKRLERWLALAGRFPAQLKEDDPDAYVGRKQRDFARQARRQRALEPR